MPSLRAADVDAAGRRLASAWRVGAFGDARHDDDRAVVDAYRDSGRANLTGVERELAALAAACGVDAVTAQRAKRSDAIARKLVRMRRLSVTTMADVWGCRIVTADLDSARLLGDELRRLTGCSVRDFKDYVSAPQVTGYRALHLRTYRDGFRVEIQVRTVRQHAWATLVQMLEEQVGVLVRDGEGSRELRRYVLALADLYATQDEGRDVDDAVVAEVRRAHAAFTGYSWQEHDDA